MARTPERSDWINTIVGMLDDSFHLTDEEQFAVAGIVRNLLDRLRIPGRSTPENIPLPVSQQMHFGLAAQELHSTRTAGAARPVRHVTASDNTTSIEAWRNTFETMLIAAYPDLALEERVLMAKTFTDVLAAIGVPNRAAATFPDAVVAEHQNLERDI